MYIYTHIITHIWHTYNSILVYVCIHIAYININTYVYVYVCYRICIRTCICTWPRMRRHKPTRPGAIAETPLITRYYVL